ncbi:MULTISPECIES: hypothetical protein [unclassified Actinomyces]|uniref:hypothetical protein n=1 Tax=unclassified Actinomyces TaxID=2609248 RepID=UPI0020178885|nr:MULTISPECIES: hypothetical protein [unclassified Actinomyces]MCL3777071.1 hypothetical protein [Actinomyces sp. AC-20-1]MCL3790291.1 hypothetical protein [Actinomyces sp. 187325]MCL3791292.1 hypothetical protein [Actinomyces sp. 186855]MCL3793795.1 hypothetical protein [Actinomyces sp. 217892]
MSNAVLSSQVRVHTWLHNLVEREEGQGAAEYAGMIVVAMIVAAAVMTAFNGFDIGAKVTEALGKIF